MDRRSLAIRAGIGAPVLALVAIVLATLLDPSFSWTESALSHTGERPPGRSTSIDLFVDRPSFLLFNGGLLITGLIGLPFAWVLAVDATHPLQRTGSALFGIALVSLAAVGLFPLPHGYHAGVAILHFIATMAFLLVMGLGTLQAGRRRHGAATIGTGLLVLAVWLGWTLSAPTSGLAIPEFVSALALGGWMIDAALRKIEEQDRRVALEGLGRRS